FAGGEEVGTRTPHPQLAERLQATGLVVDQTREPGGTPAAVEHREKLLHGTDVDPETELEWLLEDRRIHVEERIRPGLEQGVVVVCDRFTPSTLAYQGFARGLGIDDVERRCAIAAGGLEPDLV